MVLKKSFEIRDKRNQLWVVLVQGNMGMCCVCFVLFVIASKCLVSSLRIFHMDECCNRACCHKYLIHLVIKVISYSNVYVTKWVITAVGKY